MDDLDEHLIERLRVNARAPVAELARGLGLSRTTIQSRLARLERTGVIAGYGVKLAESREAAQVRAFLMLSVDPRNIAAVTEALGRVGAVRRVQTVSGVADIIASVAAGNVGELDDAIGEIGAIKGIERTQVSVVLATKFER